MCIVHQYYSCETCSHRYIYTLIFECMKNRKKIQEKMIQEKLSVVYLIMSYNRSHTTTHYFYSIYFLRSQHCLFTYNNNLSCFTTIVAGHRWAKVKIFIYLFWHLSLRRGDHSFKHITFVIFIPISLPLILF